jgi:DNA polymerase IV
MNRQIIHLDLDAFYVNCSIQKMPELYGLPLIIGGTSDRGIVASSSIEAQKYGVRPGMPTRVALMRCPTARVLKGDFDLFTQKSEEINQIIAESAPVHERSAIDEFYLDMTGMDKYVGSLQFINELAKKINRESGLPLSFGFSTNKTVAKMCSDYAKPSGSLYIDEPKVQPFLDPQSILKLPSIGEVTYKLLRRVNIKIIKTLREVPAEAIKELVGHNGLTIWDKANGIDNSPVLPYSEKKSIGTEKTFDKDTQDITDLKALIVSMVEKLGFQLRESQLMCSIIQVRIRYANNDTEITQKRLSFTSNDDILIRLAKELFDNLYKRRMLIRLLAIKVSGLVHGSYQIDLFEDSVKLVKLYEAMDKMKHRYQSSSIIRRASGMSNYEYS